jgi:GMP synthase-like glutamine amidotransferase
VIDFRRPALVLQHDAAAGPGLVGDWISERGGTAESVAVTDAGDLPSPRDYSLVVSLGSEHCAAADHGWIRREMGLLAEAHSAGVPLLGICFGGQLLARTLGAEILVSSVSEVGWRTVEAKDPRVQGGPWFQWHFDASTLPPGATLLAESSAGVEAFSLGSSVGVQFHPEVTREIVHAWAGAYATHLARQAIEPRLLLRATPSTETLRARAFRLFDGLMSAHAEPAIATPGV